MPGKDVARTGSFFSRGRREREILWRESNRSAFYLSLTTCVMASQHAASLKCLFRFRIFSFRRGARLGIGATKRRNFLVGFCVSGILEKSPITRRQIGLYEIGNWACGERGSRGSFVKILHEAPDHVGTWKRVFLAIIQGPAKPRGSTRVSGFVSNILIITKVSGKSWSNSKFSICQRNKGRSSCTERLQRKLEGRETNSNWVLSFNRSLLPPEVYSTIAVLHMHTTRDQKNLYVARIADSIAIELSALSSQCSYEL